MPLSERLYYLLNKYVSAAATPAEQDELTVLLNAPEYDELAKDRLLLLLQETTPLAQHSEERLMTLLKTMNSPEIGRSANIGRSIADRSEIGGSTPGAAEQYAFNESERPSLASEQFASGNFQKARGEKKRPVVVRLLTNNKFWWGVAAAAMLLYANFFFNHPKADPVATKPATTPVHDRTPGGNIAVLTLSDGSAIALDSAKNGIVAQQGNVKISKLSNGQLAYNGLDEKPTAVLYNTLTTPRGGQYKLVLPDGSIAWLNAASSIRYPTAFSGKERVVSITGEAYFEIAKNPSLPFKVNLPYPSGGRPEGGGGEATQIEVLGTNFNVNTYPDENVQKATLLEGSIRLLSKSAAHKLEPGQQAQVQKNGQLSVLNNANTEEAVAWKNGRFHFENADIETVMRQIARWYDVEIVFQGKIPTEKFEGEIPRNSNMSEVFKILELSNVHFKVDDKKVTVMP